MKRKQLLLITTIFFGTITPTQEATAHNYIAEVVIGTAVLGATCLLGILGWKQITESNKTERIENEKKVVNDLKAFDFSKEFSLIYDCMSKDADFIPILVERLTINNINVMDYCTTIEKRHTAFENANKKLETNLQEWEKNPHRSGLLAAGTLAKDSSDFKLNKKIISTLYNKTKDAHVRDYMELYQALYTIKNKNYTAVVGKYPLIEQHKEMQKDYNRLNAALKKFSGYSPINQNGHQQLQQLARFKNELECSSAYLLQVSNQQQEEHNKEKLRIENDKAAAQIRAAKAQEDAVRLARTNYQNQINNLERDNRCLENSKQRAFNKLEDAKKEHDALQRKINELEQEIALLKIQIAAQQKNNAQVNQTNISVGNTATSALIRQQQEEIGRLQAEISHLQNLQSLQDQNDNIPSAPAWEIILEQR